MTAVVVDVAGGMAAPTIPAGVAGDPVAFTLIVQQHQDGLHRHCYRMLRSHPEAEDAVQETFLRAWRALGTFAGRASFRTWLYQIATNTCLDEISRGRRACPTHVIEPPGPLEPDALLEAKETVEMAFVGALEILPPRQRAVFILRDMLRWSAREAAALLEMTITAVNSALQRARANLMAFGAATDVERRPHASLTVEARWLLDGYVTAVQQADARAMVELVRRDVGAGTDRSAVRRRHRHRRAGRVTTHGATNVGATAARP